MADEGESFAVEWRPVPPYDFREIKTKCEDELLDKLGTGRERLVVHPVIQLQSLQRSHTYGVIEYSPVRLTESVLRLPPTTETYGPWQVQNEACRQLLQSSRRGPRQVYFAMGKQPVVSQTEEEVQKLWMNQKTKALDAQNKRLDSVFSTWRALHSRSRLDGQRASRRDHVTTVNSLPPLSSRLRNISTRRKPRTAESNTAVGETEYLMQKVSYWRRLRETSSKLNKYARNVSKLFEIPKTEVRIYVCSTPDKLYCEILDTHTGLSHLEHVKLTNYNLKEKCPSKHTKVQSIFQFLYPKPRCFSQVPKVIMKDATLNGNMQDVAVLYNDLVEEREMLSSVTQAEVEKVCDKYGIACHFVDLRLGIDRLAGDADAGIVIKHEIEKCRKMSLGASFIALVGEELDKHPTPLQISSDVFETLREILLEENLPGLELLDDYYRLDSNNIPPVYNLQIESETESSGTEDLVKQLAFVIHRVTAIAVKRQLIEESVAQRMQLSVTQKELETGLLHLPNPERRALCIFVNKERSHFQDSTTKLRGNPESTSLDDVKDTICNFFHENCPQNLLTATHAGLKSKEYLRDLNDMVSDRIVYMLEDAISESGFDIRDHVGDISEQLHHVHMSSVLYRSFHSRQDIVTKFHEEFQGQFDLSKPVVVAGKPGVGKSTFMAKLARSLPDWMNNKCKIIVRFLGTSPESSNLFSALLVLSQQVSSMFGLASLTTEEQFSTRRLAAAFWKRVYEIGNLINKDHPLVILLDSVDAVLSANGESEIEEAMVLPQQLPSGVILIVSRKELNKSIKFSNVFVISSLAEKDVIDICKKELQDNNRRITEDQFQELKDCMPEQNALILKILLGTVQFWPSTFLPDSTEKCKEAAQKFDKLFVQVENMLGTSFTKYCLSYLALCRYGLSEKELGENLLRNETFIAESLQEKGEDKSVLKGLPVHLKVAKLLLRVSDFTMESRRDGHTVILIKAQDFSSQIIQRYFTAGECLAIHRELGMYFMLQCRDFALTGRLASASHIFKLNKLNLRMLRCVPYHLSQSHSSKHPAGDVIKSQLFCNMHWFLNRALSGPIHEVLMDFEQALKTFDDKELELFAEIIRFSRDALIHDPFHIFVILVDTLSNVPNIYSSLGALAKQAHECLKRTDVVQLLPRHKGYMKLGTILKRSYQSQCEIKAIIGNQRCAVAQANDSSLLIVDLHTEDEMLNVLQFGDISVRRMKDGNALICFDSQVLLWASNDRMVIQRIKFNHTPDSSVSLAGTDPPVLRIGQQLFVIDLNKGKLFPVTTLTNKPIAIEESVEENVCFVLHDNLSVTLTAFDLEKKEATRALRFDYMGKALDKEALLITNDGRYLVVCFQYRAVITDATSLEILFKIGEDNQCFVLSKLTGCNEHVILADTLGTITIWTLRTGEEVCTFLIMLPDDSPVTEPNQTISAIVVNEDDHFLFVGLSSGQCVVFHTPTQSQILVIQAAHSAIRSLLFMTDEKYFQHLLTCSEKGIVKLWNFQYIVSEARQAAFPFIRDDDLLNEEKLKLTKNEYYKIYTAKALDKTFLNGADVTAFFVKPLPGTFDSIARSVSTPDSKFKWSKSKCLGDCRNITMCAVGHEKPYLATFVSRAGVVLWDVVTGTLNKVLKYNRYTDSLTSIMFQDGDRFLIGIHSPTNFTEGKTRITIWNTDTGAVCFVKDELLLQYVVSRPPKILTIEKTNRDTHVKLTCIGFEIWPEPKWSVHIRLTPNVVASSEFLCEEETYVLVRRRDNSTEVRVIQVDMEDAWVNSNADRRDLDTNELSLTCMAAVRQYLFPFSSIYTGITGDQLVIITQQADVLILSITSGLTVRKFKLNGNLASQENLFNFYLQSELRENKHRLRVLLSADGSFVLLAAGNTVELWSLTSRFQMSEFTVTPGKLTAVSISEDSSTIVTGSSLGSVQVWKVHTGAMLCSFPALTRVADVTINQNGLQVVALVEDADERRVIVLDVKSPRELLSE